MPDSEYLVPQFFICGSDESVLTGYPKKRVGVKAPARFFLRGILIKFNRKYGNVPKLFQNELLEPPKDVWTFWQNDRKVEKHDKCRVFRE